MNNRKIGMWMYQNSGGDAIQQKIITQLQDREIEVIPDLNLRHSKADCGGLVCGDVDMQELDLFFSYNAGEQTLYQMYMYETLNKFIPTINNYEAFAMTEDKFKTNMVMKAAGVAAPDFFLCHRDDTDQLTSIFDKWDSKFVFKPVDGWGGMGMSLVRNKEGLDMLMPFLNSADIRFFYVERFINYDKSDFRVDIVDGHYVGCYGRQAPKDDWRTNITSGGNVIKREPNDKLVETAIRAAEVSGLEIAGVDIIYDLDKEEYVVLEVNGIPAFATPDQEKMGLDFNDEKIRRIVELIDKKTIAKSPTRRKTDVKK